MNTPTPRDRKYWTAVIHNAAQVGPNDPRYGQARAVIQMAKDSLGNLMETANDKDFAQAQPPMPSKIGGMAMNALQGFASGLGDEALGGLAGIGTIMGGGGFDEAANRVQQTQQGFNDQRHQFFGEHPGLSIAGSIPGVMMNPLNRLLAPATAGMGPVATGITYGTVLGGAQGFGEGSGGFKERLPTAATGAVWGAITGAVLGKVVKPTRALTTNIRGMVRQLLGPKAAPTEVNTAVDNVLEAAIRKDLAGRLNVRPDNVESIVAKWRQTGKLDLRAVQTNPEPPPPPLQRPGETITPKPIPGVPAPGPNVMPYGPRENLPPDPRTVAPRLRGDRLLPQDKYAETQDLRSLLKMGPKYGIEGTYAKAIREELARRAQGIMPPNTVP